ncbi:MAG: hypothetical protein CMK59_09120 [Proteobacteria bacterium]|nr:hypothetical protein [Pseudomonadota bacterium]
MSPSTKSIAQRISLWPKSPQGPVTLEIYPTLRCNLNCQFCDTTDRHRPPMNERSLKRWLEIIDEAAQIGVQQLFVLGGGEPFIFNGLEHILERAKKHGMRGMLTTNGTLINKEKIQTLLRIGWDELHLSVDAPIPAIHDELRGKKGSFQKTITTACQIAVSKRKLGLDSPKLVFHCVITNKNHKLLVEMVDLAYALGIQRVDFDHLIAYKPEQKQLELSTDQLCEFKLVAQSAHKASKKLGIESNLEGFLNATPRGSEPPKPTTNTGLKGAPCLRPWHHLVLQADGRSSPCCVLAGMGSAINDSTLSNFWQEEPFLKQLRADMIAKKPHARCVECSSNILQHEHNIRSFLPADE